MFTNFCINEFKSLLRKNSWKMAFLGLLTVYNPLNYTTVPSLISDFIQNLLKKTNLCRNFEWVRANQITCWSGHEPENGRTHVIKVLGHCAAVSRHGSAVKSIARPAHGCFVRGNAWAVSAHRHYGSNLQRHI